MPKINVYLPDELAAAVKAVDLPVSAICQKALADAVRMVGKARQVSKALRDPAFDPSEHPQLAERLTERMTARLRSVLASCHGSVGTPALLIALLDEGENLAVRLLESDGVDMAALRAAAESAPAVEADAAGGGGLWSGLTLPARSAIASALEVSIDLGHNYLGCEHLLVGLAADPSSGAGQVLAAAGVDSAGLRRAIASAAAGIMHVRQAGSAAGADKLDAVLTRLDAIERRLGAANL